MNGKQLKNSILQWAIQGKLVPQNPNDEPASVLLEKIRQEKERLIKEKKIKRDKNASIIYRGEDNSYYEKILATGEVKCIDEEIPFEIPKGWEWCRLTSLCTRFSTGPFGTMVHKTDYVDDGIPLVNPTNIKNNSISDIGICRVSLSKYNELLSYVLQKNDILLAQRGDLSKCAIVSEQHEGWLIGTGSFYLHLIGIDEHFFMMIYVSPYVQTYLIGDSIGTTMNNLNQGLLSQLLVPVPPYKEQKRIFERYTSVLPLTNIYEKRYQDKKLLDLNIYYLLKKSILQEAIQGKLVPQDPSDEPASILLQRIREEKLRLVKESKLKKKDVIDSNIFRGDDNKYYEQIGKETIEITEEIPFDLPDSWAWVRMGQIGDWGAGSTPHRSNVEYYNGDILWLKTGELNNSVVYDTEEKITQKALSECSLRLNRVGDILIAMYGATIGKVAIAGKEMTTNQACCGCTPFLVNNWYLFYYLMASRDVFIKKGEGGAQPNISRVKLVEHLMPLPPLQEQQRIVAQIEKLFEQLK